MIQAYRERMAGNDPAQPIPVAPKDDLPSPEFITSAQVQERDEWERLLKIGTLSLADGLVLMLRTGAPATPYLLARLESALQVYQYGGPDADLAKELGVQVTQRDRQRQDRATLVSYVRFHVDALHEQGYSKQDPAKFDGTAFEMAATGVLSDFTAGNLFHIYYKG